MTRIVIIMAAALLAACGELPQPFRHVEANPLLTVGTRAGVVVQPVAAVPEPQALADDLVTALHQADVLAYTGGGNAGSWLIEGSSNGDGPERLLTWRIWDAEKRLVANHTQPVAASALSMPAGRQRIAVEAAPKLAALLAGQPLEPAAKPPAPTVAVQAVKGAPGDGNAELTRAMARALRAAGYKTAEKGWQASVAAEVRLAKGERQDHVEIDWRILDPAGKELGHVHQANDIPRGQLDDRWGRLADLVAQAAAPGLNEVLRHVKPAE